MIKLLVFLVFTGIVGAATAQDAGSIKTTPENKVNQSPSTEAAPQPLSIFFETGSSTIRSEEAAALDQASRAYNEGKPIVMIISGSTDRTGTAGANLLLSQRRAVAVLNGLIARGIPADRFQVLAKGETDLSVPTDRNVAESRNRRVEITWR